MIKSPWPLILTYDLWMIRGQSRSRIRNITKIHSAVPSSIVNIS